MPLFHRHARDLILTERGELLCLAVRRRVPGADLPWTRLAPERLKSLAQAARQLKGMKERPDPKRMMKIGEGRRPWRSVASLLLWHYLHVVPADSKGR
jgi:3-methyladenine DNA glycosylase/8-oxoguanine DNA glycosylase